MQRGAGDTCRTQGWPACRDGLVLLFLVEKGQATHAEHKVGWRVETGRPYYFWWRGGRRCRTQGQLACRDGLALLFVLEERQATHAEYKVGWWVESSPADTEEERRRDKTKIWQPQHRGWGKIKK